MLTSIEQEIPVTDAHPSVPEWYYESIKECNRNASAAFVIYVLALAYAILAKSGISDGELFANAPVVVPFLGVKIPLSTFISIFPLGLGLIFVHAQNYIIRLAALVREGDKDFAGFERRRLAPWFLMISAEGFNKSEKRFLFSVTQYVITYAFWLSPLPLMQQYVELALKMNDKTFVWIGLFAWILWVPILISSWLAFFGLTLTDMLKALIHFLRTDWLEILAICLPLWHFVFNPFYELAVDIGKGDKARPVIVADYFYGPKYRQDKLYLDVSHSDMYGALLRHSCVDSTLFTSATLVKCDFSNSTMRKCAFNGATLRRTDLSFCDLTNSSFEGAQMIFVDFWNSNLDSCDFHLASFDQVDLRNASLIGAKNLTTSQLLRASSLYGCVFEAQLRDSIQTLAPALLSVSPKIDSLRLKILLNEDY